MMDQDLAREDSSSSVEPGCIAAKAPWKALELHIYTVAEVTEGGAATLGDGGNRHAA